MNTVDICEAEQNLEKLIESVNKSHEPIRIRDRSGKSVILIGYDDLLSIQNRISKS